jgi:PAS domain S-box-containing protein
MTATRTRGLLVISLPMVAIVVLSLAGLLIASAQQAAAVDGRRNAEIYERAESLLVGLLNSETGVRGFLLTGDAQFLGPYLESQARIPRDLDALASEIGEDDELRPAFVRVRDSVLAGSLALAGLRQRGETGARLASALIASKATMDNVRASLRELTAEAAAQVDRSTARRASLREIQSWVFVFALAVGVGGGLTAGWWFIRWVDATMARVRELYDNAPCGYHSGDARTMIVEINDTELRWLGRTRAEVVGRMRLVEMLTAESRERVLARYDDYVRTGVLTDLEIDLVAADGTVRPVSLTSTAVYDSNGEYIGSRSTMFDITERRRADEGRRALAAQLERSLSEQVLLNRELEAFSYSVAHDLRSPLRSIDGYSQAVLEDYGDKLDEQGKHYLTRLRAGAQRMAALIDDLLGLARVTRATVDRRLIDLSALARSVAQEVAEPEPERRVDWVIADGLTASSDAVLMKVLLQNLFANAFKFTSRVEHARIELGVEAHAGAMAFFVRDNGAGFDMQYAQRLFGVFQRLHSEQEFPGTGVGLATVQRIVHKHGGEVSAEGAPGCGATIWFTLPSESVPFTAEVHP